jgi:hypothetical protein
LKELAAKRMREEGQRGLDMKRILVAASVMLGTAIPASASSFEYLDSMVTGEQGKSIIVLQSIDECAGDEACDVFDGAEMLTSSAPLVEVSKTLNTAFARKFPDPASPVPLPAASASAPEPELPAGIGSVPSQPPVQTSSQPPMSPQMQGAPDTSNMPPEMRGSSADASPIEQAANIDPASSASNAPRMIPMRNDEQRESE